ncbi:hypothetical protein GYH30_011699 [Glycine max]|nr:hypothetical protein GYH30_011699 [Glycine max]
MLRFSEVEKKVVREFKILHVVDHPNRSFSGRVFHSLTLFEDMVKCILLCNRQWPRMLSMARALCELQLELQNGLPCTIVVSGNSKGESEGFIPKTLASKETRRNKVSTKGIFCKKKIELDGNLQIDHVVASSSIAIGNSLMGICKLTT